MTLNSLTDFKTFKELSELTSFQYSGTMHYTRAQTQLAFIYIEFFKDINQQIRRKEPLKIK